MTSVFSEVTLQELQGELLSYHGKSTIFGYVSNLGVRPQYHLGLNIMVFHFAFIDTICAINLCNEE